MYAGTSSSVFFPVITGRFGTNYLHVTHIFNSIIFVCKHAFSFNSTYALLCEIIRNVITEYIIRKLNSKMKVHWVCKSMHTPIFLDYKTSILPWKKEFWNSWLSSIDGDLNPVHVGRWMRTKFQVLKFILLWDLYVKRNIAGGAWTHERTSARAHERFQAFCVLWLQNP